jgi:hypothetical protein
VAFTQLATAFNETEVTGGIARSTTSVSPTAGSLMLLCMTIAGEPAGPAPTSVSGVCGTWTVATKSGYDGANGGWAHVYWGVATGTGAISATWADDSFGWGYNVVEVTGASSVVQSAQGTGAGTDNDLVATLAAFASGSNWTFAFGVGDASASAGSAFLAGAGFTELVSSDTQTQFGFHKACEWQEAADTSVEMTMANNGVWGIIALEIGVAAAGTSVPWRPSQRFQRGKRYSKKRRAA